jgi:orotate phosphoribosyltransferase
MRGTEGSTTALLPSRSRLATNFLFSDLRQTPACPSQGTLAELADRPGLDIPDAVRGHLSKCPHCAETFAAFRAAACVAGLPRRFVVALTEIHLPAAEDRTVEAYQILGCIGLESRCFKACEPADWLPDPLCIRVNLVLDESSDFLSLTLLDVPDELASVTLTTPRGQEAMLKTADGAFEFVRTFDEYLFDDPPGSYITFLNAGLLQAVFERADRPGAGFQAEVTDLLAAAGAVERAFDYVLPSGLHSDTHVRVGKLCHSENWLKGIAGAFDRLFVDVSFDAIAAAGWPMATIGRRLAALRVRPKKAIPHVVLCEGYAPPRLLGDLPPGSRVLVLVDVVVTGTLVERVSTAVRRTGAVVVGAGAVVQSQHPNALARDSLRALSGVPMHVVAARDCPRCGRVERREFNPFAHSMTAKAPTARSPSQFLDYDADAREFWEYVDLVGAYEHHRVERGAHYIAFVDTLKMLEHPEVGAKVVAKLRDLLLDRADSPEAILVPNLKRAKVLAERLCDVLTPKEARRRISLLTACSQNGHWRLSRAARCRLYAKSVLIVDSATGHGRTLDELSMLAHACGASRVGGAVLLSRLTESAEESFRARLNGGFYRLYNLPVRPVLIYGDDKDVCPVCQRKAAVTKAAEDSRLEAIKQLASWLTQRGGHASGPCETGSAAPATHQPTLFPADSSFLVKCSSQVASGVTLHSLHAAMTNGMAPLALPEASDPQIPKRNRLAMLENLPVGVVGWSKGVLDRQLQDLLAREDTSSLWRASACVLARERHLDWVEHLPGFLDRCAALGSGPQPMFWNNLVCSAYLASHDDALARGELRRHVEEILRTHTGGHAAAGLRRIMEAIALVGSAEHSHH